MCSFIFIIIKDMPPKSANTQTTQTTKRGTTDLKIPTKADGTKDKRYNMPQFVNKDGSRDMRTTLTNNRK